jgi:hypothetical protein
MDDAETEKRKGSFDSNRTASFSIGDTQFVDKVVQPANFQRTFQLVPEAVALGLFDVSASLAGSSSNGVSSSVKAVAAADRESDLQQLTQVFVRFMLSQLSKELHEVEAASIEQMKGNAIDRVFGFFVRSCTTFLQSGVNEVAATAMQSWTVELLYANPKSQKSKILFLSWPSMQ